MIRTETYEINGVPFVRTYSDVGRYVVRDGVSYDEANDPAEFNHQYIEGDIITDDEALLEKEEYAIAGRIMMGVDP